MGENNIIIITTPKRFIFNRFFIILLIFSVFPIKFYSAFSFFKFPLLYLATIVVIPIIAAIYITKKTYYKIEFNKKEGIIFFHGVKELSINRADILSWKLYLYTFGRRTDFIFECNFKNGEIITYPLQFELAKDAIGSLFEETLQIEPTSISYTNQFGKSPRPWLFWGLMISYIFFALLMYYVSLMN